MRGKALEESKADHSIVDSRALLAVARPGKRWLIGIVFCLLVFVVGVLLGITPLARIPDTEIALHIPLGSFVGTASNWLPTHLGNRDPSSSASLEFFCLITLVFLAYGLALVLVGKQAENRQQKPVRFCLWLGAVLAGSIYVVTPALLSHDMMVYAGYGRLLAIHHVNPYFVPLSSFPHDPIAPFNQWFRSTSAYGPLWILVCGFWGAVLKADPTTYALAFRLFALATHLGNTWLVGRTLQVTGRSPRVITLGMLFYAWNPLVLLESSLDGHNDVFMLTFVLLGMLLAARAERSGQLLHWRGYLLPGVALTLATLIKFTALPILAAYLLFLACKALRLADSPQELRCALAHWLRASAVLCWSGLTAVLVALALYAPFWFGHSLRAIAHSFTLVPSAIGGKHSFMASSSYWLQLHPVQAQIPLLGLLRKRRFWDGLNYLALALCLALGVIRLWPRPTLSTLRTLALATMCLVLLITPWFYPWYITWIVGLAAICIPTRARRITRALVALALLFSYSALSFYISGLLGPHSYLWPLFATLPPVCAFLLCWIGL